MSKANQKFVQADEAVSPVIGVILMVAITVVLAAVVFVLVSNLSKGTGDTTPAVSFQQNDGTDRLEVTSAASNADWNRLAIGPGAVTLKFNLNADATNGAGTVRSTTANVEITGTADPMSAGEYLDFCGVGGALTDVSFTLIDTAANAKVGDFNFLSVAACTA